MSRHPWTQAYTLPLVRSLLRGKDMEQADRRRAKLMSIVNYLYLMPLRQHHIASRSVAKIERTRVINARRLLLLLLVCVSFTIIGQP